MFLRRNEKYKCQHHKIDENVVTAQAYEYFRGQYFDFAPDACALTASVEKWRQPNERVWL